MREARDFGAGVTLQGKAYTDARGDILPLRFVCHASEPTAWTACTTISLSTDPCSPNLSLYLSSYFALPDSNACSRPGRHFTTLLAGTTGNGVLISNDGGARWTTPGQNIPASTTVNAFAASTAAPEVIYAGTDDGGCVKFGSTPLPSGAACGAGTVCLPSLPHLRRLEHRPQRR